MARTLRFPGGKPKALTLSYDDGVFSDRRLIELMQKYGIKGTFNINSGTFGNVKERRLSVEEAKALYVNSGMEVALHGMYHVRPTTLHDVEIFKEFLTDRENLENIFGGVIRGLAYAYGVFTDEVVEALKQIGVVYGRELTNTYAFDIPSDWLRLRPTCHHDSKQFAELTDTFINAELDTYRINQPMLFYLWGHSYEFDDHDNWQVIEDFCKKVGNRDDIWYATNVEVYDYVKAYENLQFAVNGKAVKNDSAQDVYFRTYGRTIKAKAGTITEF